MSYTYFRRSVGILLGLASCGLGLQACGSDTTGGTSSTGEAGGAPSTTSTSTSTSAGGAGGASSTSITVGVGGAGGATSSSSSGSSGSSSSGSSGSGSSGSSASSSSGGSTSSSSSASTGSTGSGSSSASTGTGSGSACTETTLEAFKTYLLGDDDFALYTSLASPNLGDPASYDKLFLEFYGPNTAPTLDGDLKGVFDLSAGSDGNYATCSRCLFLIEDFSGTNTFFFQKSGTMSVDATSDQLKGTVHATVTDVTLVEVTLDSMGVSTPVPNGACRHVTSAAVNVVPAVVPAGWVCNPLDYANGVCSCGCGVVDVDCDDATVAACEYCDDIDSCSATACPGTINPTNNAVCN